MDYISTRGQDGPLSYEQALLNGLAHDGGLYLPVDWPRFSKAEIQEMKSLSYEALAARIMAPFTKGILSEAELQAMAADAFLYSLPADRLQDRNAFRGGKSFFEVA